MDFNHCSETNLTSVVDLLDSLKLLSKSNPSSVVEAANTSSCGVAIHMSIKKEDRTPRG